MSVDEAQATGHAVRCVTPSHGGCPIALWVGNLAAAERYTRLAARSFEKARLAALECVRLRFQRVVVSHGRRSRRGIAATAQRPRRNRRAQRGLWFPTGLSQIAEPWAMRGGSPKGWRRSSRHRAVRRRLAHTRVAAYQRRTLLLQGTPGTAEAAKDLFRQALDGRAGKERCHGSCARRRASPACCAIRAAPPTPSHASSRSTIASRRVSAPPILSRRNSFWTNSAPTPVAEPRHRPATNLRSRLAHSGSSQRGGCCSKATNPCGWAAGPSTS